MRVVFYDIATKLPMGNNRARRIARASCSAPRDFVTLHVPETPQTQGHDRRRASWRAMKHGRVPAQRQPRHRGRSSRRSPRRSRSGHLGGAAVDVYPEEPETNTRRLRAPLQRPAQRDPDAAHRRLDRGGAGGDRPRGRDGADQVRQHRRHDRRGELPAGRAAAARGGTHRILNVHRNVPGVLRDINRIVSDLARQHPTARCWRPTRTIGYLMMDLDQDVSRRGRAADRRARTNIRTRVLY